MPSDVPTCTTNLFRIRWLSQAVDELNKDPAGIVHCWEETKLLRAWEGAVQAEAAGKANELFPNSSRDDYLCRPTSRRTQRPASWDFHSLSPSRSTSAKAGSTGTSLKSSSQRSTNHVYSSGFGTQSFIYISPFFSQNSLNSHHFTPQNRASARRRYAAPKQTCLPLSQGAKDLCPG